MAEDDMLYLGKPSWLPLIAAAILQVQSLNLLTDVVRHCSISGDSKRVVIML